jgi:septation ring formation regulator EzrA
MKAHDNQISNYIESRLTRVETVIESINQNLKEIKESQKTMDQKIENLGTRIDNLKIRMDEKISNLGTRINNLLYWMLGSIFLPAGSASFIYILKSLHAIS